MNETPFQKRIQEARTANSGGLCLFRAGDFYGMFYEDAKIGAKTLGLTLIVGNKGLDTLPMCGLPFWQRDAYVGKLTAEGYRVAIIEEG